MIPPPGLTCRRKPRGCWGRTADSALPPRRRGGGCGHTPAPSAAGTEGPGGGLSEGTAPEARESLADPAGEGVGCGSEPGGAGRGGPALRMQAWHRARPPRPPPTALGGALCPLPPPCPLPSGAPPAAPPTSPANVPLGAPILCSRANVFTRRPYLGGGKLASRPGFNSPPGPLLNQVPA